MTDSPISTLAIPLAALPHRYGPLSNEMVFSMGRLLAERLADCHDRGETFGGLDPERIEVIIRNSHSGTIQPNDILDLSITPPVALADEISPATEVQQLGQLLSSWLTADLRDRERDLIQAMTRPDPISARDIARTIPEWQEPPAEFIPEEFAPDAYIPSPLSPAPVVSRPTHSPPMTRERMWTWLLLGGAMWLIAILVVGLWAAGYFENPKKKSSIRIMRFAA